MKIMALILARGGSTRIPNKNIATLGGNPLIYYPIKNAKESKYINKIVVSTDSKEIKEIAIRYGAEVIDRPPNISQTNSTELDAFRHTLVELEKQGYVPDIIVKLPPTSPFRRTESVDFCIKLLVDNPQADSARSVRLCKEHPFKMWRMGDQNELIHFIPETMKPNQAHTLSYQSLPPVYINNASIDVTKPSTILEQNSITGRKILAYLMDEIDSFDINTPLDLVIANKLMEEM